MWAIICEFLGDMQPDARNKLQGWLYDDMCHLMPFAGNISYEQDHIHTIISKATKKFTRFFLQNIYFTPEKAAQK